MERKYINSLEEAKQLFVNFCLYRERCHSEIEIKFNQYVLIDEFKDIILLFLIENNYLNEERYVKSYVRGKFNQNGWGKNKIKLALKEKKINEKLIKIGLNEIDSDEYFNFLEKKIISYKDKIIEKNKFKKLQKIKNHFLQKGFEIQLILEILQKEEEKN